MISPVLLLGSIRREIGPCRNLENFLARRARVRDDSGRSPQIEIDLERSFDGTLSHQSVCEQTSGVLRHTERVRDDKVQEQDWRHALEQKFCARRPLTHAVAAAGADSKDPEVHSAVQADESLTKSAFPKVEVLYVVMGCSETSVLSTRRRRGAKPLAVSAAAIEKPLRRRCSRLLRQRQDFEWSNSLQRCCGRPLCFFNGHLQ